MRIVVVSAGLSVPSSTRLLADRLAAATVERLPADTDLQVVELRDLAVEIAHNFVTGFPGPALSRAIDAVTGADGLIVVTPVFTASYSGLFKSFFDVIDKDALDGKPVLIAATGGTPRHSLVLEHALRPLFAYLRAVVVPTAVYAASEDWGADGLAARIERAGAELAALVGAVGPVRGLAEPVPVPRTRPAGEDIAGTTGLTLDGSAEGPGPEPGAGAADRPVNGSADDKPLEVIPFEQQLAALRVG
ncbi:FMN reductase [Streptomyces himalayensis]|uniref:FMN reductase n=1 Tax=Streptomyces himalayensis subsp. himalayensis TaxID=2756131 RepID=A0A7W0ICK2_9ACTN|nr:FMN reductase [Streptomyces himalayensis]MBA2950643.1 FMN reductase [Streptomyces himalayensis subsp. himalayensis]